jgi:hypothetical protein
MEKPPAQIIARCRAPMRSPREACLDVEGLRLQRLQPGNPLTLEELGARHGAALQEAAAKLEQV